jgi:hypothetical protein
MGPYGYLPGLPGQGFDEWEPDGIHLGLFLTFQPSKHSYGAHMGF